MSIISEAIVENRIGEEELIRLTDDSGSGTTGSAALTQAISQGEGEILSYLGRRYRLPLALTSTYTAGLVEAVCLDAVIYRLYLRKRIVPEDIRAAYERSIAWAKDAAAGRVVLEGETTADDPPAAGGIMIAETTERIMSREDMDGL